MMIANGFGCTLNFGRMTFALAEKYFVDLQINYIYKNIFRSNQYNQSNKVS